MRTDNLLLSLITLVATSLTLSSQLKAAPDALPDTLITSIEGLNKEEQADETPERLAVPKDLIEKGDDTEELGVNEFTAPSIRLIFDDLDKLMPMPVKETQHKLPQRMPISRPDLAMEIGFLIADGFLAVQHGNFDEIEPLAVELSKYGRALGTGERVNRHVTSILESAKNKDVEKLKDELSATQKDVEKELVQLRDADLAHLISFGGWLRALECAAVGVDNDFTVERAYRLLREDIAEYYESSIGSLDPAISKLPNYVTMRNICSGLKVTMTRSDEQPPSKEVVKEIAEQAKKLARLALTRTK